MRKIVLKTAVSIFAIGSIFILLISLFGNKNLMIVDMNSSYAPLEAEFYYTTEGQPFSNNKMSRRYKVKGNKYYFRVPSFDKMQYGRFDPAKRVTNITLNSIIFISNRWFKTYKYSLDVTKSKIISQIKEIKLHNGSLDIIVENKDPQLAINMNRKLEYVSNNLHLEMFLIAVLIYFILIFIYRIYKQEELNEKLYAKLILYSIFLAFSIFKVDYYREHVHYNYTPDNIAHLSYIEYLHKTKEFMPDFKKMSMITNKYAGNYLGHPPLYYHLMNLVYDKNLSILGNVNNFRVLNNIIYVFSILLLFYIGFKTNLSIVGHFVYLGVIVSIPMHAYLGSNVNNDNLAILGGVVYAVGVYRLLYNSKSIFNYFIFALGIFLAFFGKLTAGILVFFATIYLLIYFKKSKIKLELNSAKVSILLLFIVPTVVYQIYILLTYHALAPTLNVTHPQEYLHSGYYIPEALRVYKTPLEWLKNYWDNIYAGWFAILSHHSLVKPSFVDILGLLILHIIAIVALFFKCYGDNRNFCILGKISMLALFSVMLIQYGFSYKAHLHSGYMGGLQPRYLLPFMFSFAIMASIMIDRYRKSFFINIVVIVLVLHALYSDFFYFLKYYI